jgi:uncharacterized membrane protein YbhN (UPF0104 family)
LDAFFDAVRSFFEHLAAVDFTALAVAVLLHVCRLLVRTRAWRNIIAAAYPETRVRWGGVLGAYLGGVGLNAITPARGGDVLKLFLVKRRVEGSTYPTLGATLIVETLFDALIGLALLAWAIHLGVLPSFDRLPDLPSIDWGLPFEYPRLATAIALVLGIGIGIGLVLATRRVREFWSRVAQGLSILRDPGLYLRSVVPWQALSWGLRLAAIYWFLRALGIPASVHNAFVAQLAQSLATILPITPGGAGTEQGLLLYLFRGEASRSALLSFSVGMHITIVVVNVLLGVFAVALITRSFRFGRVRREALGDPEGAQVGDRVAGSPPP